MSFIDAPIGTRMDCFALVKKSEVRTSAKGSQYLDMDLADKDGEINAKFWAYENSATPNFQPNDIVKIRGTINEYRGTRQFRIERIRPALKTDNVDPADYVAAAEYSGEAMYNAICDLARSFQDDDLRELVLAVYQKYRESLLTHPAAIRLHHAMRGGLLYHTLSIIRMAQAAAKVYPSIDEDLLLTGAALHDIAGLRVVLSSVESVYRYAALLTASPLAEFVLSRDYIAKPKASGYRSLHLLMMVPVIHRGQHIRVPIEIQLRTTAMDAWAVFDHDVYYKPCSPGFLALT